MKKSKLVKQQGSSDCGAACLVSVAAHFGLNVSLRKVTQHAGGDGHGISVYGLIEAARLLKFEVKAVRITGFSLSYIPLPAVFHVQSEDLRHFVVLYKMNKEVVIIMDPAVGKLISVPAPEFIKFLSGTVLILIPSADFRKSDQTAVKLSIALT
jgi:ATP-binding cassette, subfamily C, bacteriocin exporter